MDTMTAQIEREVQVAGLPGPICPLCGGTGYTRVEVLPGHPMFGKAIPCECRKAEWARKRAAKLRRRSGISDEQLGGWTFGTYEPERSVPLRGKSASGCRQLVANVKRACERYAGAPEGWLVIVGAVGCGKTHLAYAIAAEALRRGKAVYAGTAPDMLDMLRGTYKTGDFDAWFGELRSVDLLIIDDLGTENQSAWSSEKLYQIVNHRYANRLPLVVTSNVPLAQAGNRIERRIISRLMEGARAGGGWSRELVIPAADYRPTARAGGNEDESEGGQ